MSELITDIHRKPASKLVLPSSLTQSGTGGFKGDNYVPFKQRHRSNDAVMVPDRGFRKQLKKLDPDFEVLWNYRSSHWAIWCFPVGKPPYHVMDVLAKGKTYRELGQDILNQLQQCVKWTAEGADVIGYIEEHNNQMRRRKEQDFRNKIEAITLETFNYSRGVLQVQVPRSSKMQEALR